MGLCADGGQFEVFVGSQLGDEEPEESHQPDVAEEDESEDGEDEDRGSEDAFHGPT